jgi:very-short-patch-repair endonuclease
LEEHTYRKDLVVRFLKKHFIENTHYIIKKGCDVKKHGGQNKHDYYLTNHAYELLTNSYNINNRYSPHIQVNTIMSLENQTIGFITACLKDICDCVRQKRIGNYRADLCINECIVVECDEFGHDDRDPNAELQREIFIESQGYEIVRFNPNEPGFDLSKVINTILGLITAETEADKQRHHEERMLELAIQQSDRDIQLKKLDVELKKLDIQSQQLQLQPLLAMQQPTLISPQARLSSSHVVQSTRCSGPKKVSQYSLDGQFLQTFNSLKAAATHVHGNRKTLGSVCGTETTYKNYIWKLVQ